MITMVMLITLVIIVQWYDDYIGDYNGDDD